MLAGNRDTVAWPRVLHCTLVQVTHKAVGRGERGLFGIGHGNGVLSVDCHCEASPGSSIGSGAGRRSTI